MDFKRYHGYQGNKEQGINEMSQGELLLLLYDELYKRVEALYDVFKAQWDRECKLNGFEHHDARYGALLMRIKHCRQILNDYASDKTENIPALDEGILPPHTVDAPLGKTVNFNNWAMTALVKHADD